MSFWQKWLKAGSARNLPFLLLLGLWAGFSSLEAAETNVVLTFQKFQSSCIDLGRYDSKLQQLTVRFVNRNPERFYRYSKVSPTIWKKLKELNETGSVGEFLNDTIVKQPEKYPYEELTIPRYKTKALPQKLKPGNSK